ncbi:MAG: hypothetical protein JW912_00010 [Sedimentisphaerales bacterium]|nr:hypothetical protein [Sedimentisphaerales bacterium]
MDVYCLFGILLVMGLAVCCCYSAEIDANLRLKHKSRRSKTMGSKKLLIGSQIAMVFMVFSACSVALAEESSSTLGVDFSVDYVGKYIWRGQNLQDDGAIQPSINLTYGNLTANVWGSVEMSSINNNSGEITEVDYTLDYSDAFPGLEGVGYSIGVINYQFPNTTVDDTTELYAGLSLDWLFSPSLTFYRDVDEVKGGTYVSLGFSHSFDSIGEIVSGVPIGLDVSASLGWANKTYNKAYWTGGPGVNTSGMNDFVLSIAFPMEFSNGWSLTPSLNYVTLMDGDIRDCNGFSEDDSFFFAGISLSKSF